MSPGYSEGSRSFYNGQVVLSWASDSDQGGGLRMDEAIALLPSSWGKQ